MVSNKLVKSNPSGLKVLMGKSLVITSKICVAPSDEAEALLIPFLAIFEGPPLVLLTIVYVLFLFEGGVFDSECRDLSPVYFGTFGSLVIFSFLSTFCFFASTGLIACLFIRLIVLFPLTPVSAYSTIFG